MKSMDRKIRLQTDSGGIKMRNLEEIKFAPGVKNTERQDFQRKGG
jgi:hypothetical protein